MLPPFLFVGIGGSGGDTLRHLYRELDVRLRQVGIRTMPEGWQFAHIDCGSTEEHSTVLLDKYRHKYVGMAPRGVSYRVIDEALSQRSPQVRDACLGWRPDPRRVFVTVTEGAGQYRAIGRMVAALKLGDIRTTLTSLAQQVDGADLAEVSRAFGVPIDDGQARPTVVVFSSLAGGTGAGTFLDVCDVLRGIGYPWCADPVAILYGPDVFGGFKAEDARGIHANALATISELLAGYWVGDPEQDPVHRAAGVQFHHGQRSGPAYTFLVGSKNESGRLQFSDHQDVFAVVARTVAAWTTSKLLQQQVSAYLESNWQQHAELPDPLGLADHALDMPLSALGYASLGLGRHLFHRYVAQCLAKVAAGRLLHGSKGVDVYDTSAEPDTSEIVRLDSDRFAAAVLGLPGPVGSATGDLGEGLRAALHPHRRQALDAMKAEIRERIGTTSLPRGEWRIRVVTEVRQRTTGFVDGQLDTIGKSAESWIDAVQKVVHDELLRSLSVDGLVAARDLVMDTSRRLREEVPALELAAGTDRTEAERMPGEVELALGTERRMLLRRGHALLPPGNELVGHAVSRAVDAMGRKLDAEVRLLCARLLDDFANRMLRPAAEALSAGLHALRADTVSTRNGGPAQVSSWPQGPTFGVPPGLRPSRNQFLVDYVEDYPAVFRQQIVRAVPGANLADDAVITAVRDILLTPPDAESGLPDLLEQTATWQPRMMRNRTDLARTEQPGGFRLHVSADDLLDRCMAWAEAAPSLGAYLSQDLAGALGTDRPNAEQQERLHRYEEKLVLALTASAPLVTIDASYRAMYLSQGSAAYTPLITQIPLRQDTAAYERTRELLRQHTSLTDARVEDLFGDSGRDEIEFTTFLTAPCHPVAFSSLMDPMHIDWREKSDDPIARETFAKWRRARPMPRAVPLPPDVRRTVMRGFLIEALINPPELLDSGRVLLLTGQHGTTNEFPLFGRVPDGTDVLDAMAALLESVPLALLEQRDRRAPAVLGLQHLVAVGQPPYSRLFGPQTLDLPARVAKLASESRDRLAEQVPDHRIDRVWELRADIIAVLDELARALEGGQR